MDLIKKVQSKRKIKKIVFYGTIGFSALLIVLIPTSIFIANNNQNSSNDVNNPEPINKTVESLTNFDIKSNDGNFIFNSDINNNLKLWNKSEIIKSFSNVKEDINYGNGSKLDIELTTNKESINLLKDRITSNFFQVNFIDQSNITTLKFTDLNLTSFINSPGSIIKLSFGFNASNNCEWVKMGLFLENGYQWSNNLVQTLPNEGWNSWLQDFAPEYLKENTPSGFLFIANGDNSQLGTKSKLNSLMPKAFESKDGNFLFNSSGNKSLNTWTKTDIQNIFQINPITENRIYFELSNFNKIAIDQIKSKITQPLEHTNPIDYSSPYPTIEFNQLNWTDVMNSDGVTVRLIIDFNNSNQCTWITLIVFLKDGYSWSNGEIQRKPETGWDNIFQELASDALKEGNGSGYIFSLYN